MCPDLVNLLPVENGFRSIQVPWVQLYAAHGKTNPWHYLVYLMDMRSMTHSALGPIVYSKFSAICSASWRAFGLHLVLSPIPQVFVRALCSKNQTQNENGIYIYIFTYQYHLLESSKPKHLQKSAATRSITFEIRSHWKTWTIHLNICIASREPELLTFLWRLVRFYCKSHFAELARRPWTNECVAAWPRIHVESIWLPSGIFALWLGNEHADIVTLRCSVSCRLARCGLIDVLGLTWWTIHEFSKRQVFFEPQCSVRQMQLCLFMPQACSYTVIDFTLVWRGNLS